MTIVSNRVTLDTNIAVYAMTQSIKHEPAKAVLGECDFLSVQVLNEYANYSVRKQKRTIIEAEGDLELLTEIIPDIASISLSDHREALRIAARYRLSFYDSLMIAVALSGGADVLYSEDMQHGLVIDDRLTITNPFLRADSL